MGTSIAGFLAPGQPNTVPATAADQYLYSTAAGVWALATVTAGGRAVLNLSWSAGTQVPSLTAAGTAAMLTVGTAANNLVQLDGTAKLPAVDGSLLTNLPAGTLDATLTAVAAWSWTSGVEVKTLTAADTFGTLNVGTAANNLVQMTAAAKLPAVDGSLVTGVVASTAGSLSLVNSWSAVNYVAHTDGRANGAGWTENAGTNSTGTTDGITHHLISATSGLDAYIKRNISITSADSWELQVEMSAVSLSFQSSFIIYDGTRRVWLNHSSSGISDQTAGAYPVTEPDRTGVFVIVTVIKRGGTTGTVEVWLGPKYQGRKNYGSFAANATAAALWVGKITTSGASDVYIRSVKLNVPGTWNSQPDALFVNTSWGR